MTYKKFQKGISYSFTFLKLTTPSLHTGQPLVGVDTMVSESIFPISPSLPYPAVNVTYFPRPYLSLVELPCILRSADSSYGSTLGAVCEREAEVVDRHIVHDSSA